MDWGSGRASKRERETEKAKEVRDTRELSSKNRWTWWETCRDERKL